MIDLIVFVAIMQVAHYLGDFTLQTDVMAVGKSKSNSVLLSHVGVYSLNLLLFGVIAVLLGLVTPQYIAFWVLLNGILHFCTDWLTSRASARFQAEGRTKDFWGMIGLDQMIHSLTLLLTTYHLFVLSGLI